MRFPESEFDQVRADAHAVMREAIESGVWIVGGGFAGFHPSVVTGDGFTSDGPLAETTHHIGGFAVLQVESREAAIHWASRIAKACRCSQEMREIMSDPQQEMWQGKL